uniref:DUS-like FMN-binding domain-containing protein n=1 Tax=Setaria digitata TaxID=48799 RepID=A0A915PLC9_9BILA
MKGELYDLLVGESIQGENITNDKHIDNQIPLFIAAPMVRYSKLPFRMLVRLYSADVAFTPMIYAKHFIASEQCRSAEFTTCPGDNPTIVQFASNEPEEFSMAAMFMSKYCRGVDLNCGCPQRDVMKEGYGSSLLVDPVRIADIIATTRRRISKPDFTVSIKIRLKPNRQLTLETCRQAEIAGVSFITVHGRTPEQRSEPVDYDMIKLIKSDLSIPVIANGNIKSYEQALKVAKYTGVDGVMSANGLLENPAMFAGYTSTPKQCVADWVRLATEHGCPFDLFHQQLIFMLRSSLSSGQRTIFNGLCSYPAVFDYLSHNIFKSDVYF